VVRWASMPWSLTDSEKESALEAIQDALAKLPQGTPLSQLEIARDHAIQTIAAQHEHRQLCSRVLGSIANEFAREDERLREGCKEIVSRLLAQLPVGTSEQMMVQFC